MSISYRVKQCLDERQLSWDSVQHTRSGTCMEAARLASKLPKGCD